MAKMKQLYTEGNTDTTLQLIDKAINLLTGDYVWSDDLNKIKPTLIQILQQYDSASILWAQRLMRE